jgi:hypothetical protein
VEIVGLEIERVGVRKQMLQALGDSEAALLVDTDVDAGFRGCVLLYLEMF